MKKLLAALTFLLAPALAFGTSVTPFPITLPNGNIGTVLATNDAGDQVGRYLPLPQFPIIAPDVLGFELDHHGVFTPVGPSFVLQFGIRDRAIAVDINNRGDIIGLWNPFETGEPAIFQGFLFADNVYTNIEFLLPSSIPHCLDHETVLTSIADNGDIFGRFRYGNIAGPCSPGGQIDGTFVWRRGLFFTNDVPGFGKIPEPTSWLLFGLGLMGVARVGRRIA